MILIFTRAADPAANGVVAWLARSGRTVIRVNEEDVAASADLCLTNVGANFVVAGRSFGLDDIEAVWFRKGSFWFPPAATPIDLPDRPVLAAKLTARMRDEERVAAEYFHHLLRSKGTRVLGNPALPQPNKLIMLHHAAALGMSVPSFDVVRRLSARHAANPSDFITKSLSDGIYLWDFADTGQGYFSYTETLTDVPGLPDADAPMQTSLIQEKVEKAFEVRVFYLDGAFFAAAILSQGDAQTAVDYRKYNYARPNRNVPVTLPAEIECRLDALFRRVELNTGSADLIVDRDGNHVFLEINPTGQWGGIADVCNYDIDARIARWLTGDTQDGRSVAISPYAATA